MDFTREPIIETIVTPKEGYKLIVRRSNGAEQEEYSVDAVEVVSFGRSFFFRSLEKPKAFLFPISEYEIIETRETRSVLKKAQIEKSIKIAGGKTSPAQRTKNSEEEEIPPSKEERVRGRRESRRRETERERKEESIRSGGPTEDEKEVEEIENSILIASPSVRRTLLPPPTGLISEQIDRYKDFLRTDGKEKSGKESSLRKTASSEEEKEAERQLSFSFGEETEPPLEETPLFEGEEEDRVIDFESEVPTSPETEE